MASRIAVERGYIWPSRIAVDKPHIRIQHGKTVNGQAVPWVCYQLNKKPSYGATPAYAWTNFYVRNLYNCSTADCLWHGQ